MDLYYIKRQITSKKIFLVSNNTPILYFNPPPQKKFLSDAHSKEEILRKFTTITCNAECKAIMLGHIRRRHGAAERLTSFRPASFGEAIPHGNTYAYLAIRRTVFSPLVRGSYAKALSTYQCGEKKRCSKTFNVPPLHTHQRFPL